MLFYPFDFSYFGSNELKNFSENLDKFKAINCDVIAISTDSHYTHMAWVKL